MTWQADKEFETKRIKSVADAKDGATELTFTDGWSLWCPANERRPRPGDRVRLYGKGRGYTVRGIVIDDTIYKYETAEEYECRMQSEQLAAAVKRREEYAAQKPENDRRIAALPAPLRERIERFRANRDSVGPELEAYELFCCEQAAAIAMAAMEGVVSAASASGERVPAETIAKRADEWIVAWRGMEWDAQKRLVAALDDGHSGNTFGCAVSLARLVISRPEAIAGLPGAMSPVVGSKAYEPVA